MAKFVEADPAFMIQDPDATPNLDDAKMVLDASGRAASSRRGSTSTEKATPATTSS